MCTLLKPESIIALMGVVIGALIAIVTIYYGNRNNRKQIRTGKLEEIFQAVQVLSRHYGILMELWHKVQQLRDSDDQELRTLNEYYEVRDQRLTPELRTTMMELLSRLEVLTECYTEGNLKKELRAWRIHF